MGLWEDTKMLRKDSPSPSSSSSLTPSPAQVQAGSKAGDAAMFWGDVKLVEPGKQATRQQEVSGVD